jgi:tetratricopeptide (TPR) repeat protein
MMTDSDAGPDVRSDTHDVLRREIAEVHAVASRTSNAVSTLASSLKDVVVRQERLERGLNLSSFVAYIIFTALLAGGFFLLYRSRAGQLVGERDAAVRGRDEALADAQAARKEVAARDQAARKAYDFWQLVATGKRADAIARYPEMVGEKLTPTEEQVFKDAVAKARAELVDQGFAAGVEAFKGEQWKRVAVEMKKAMSFEDDGPRAAQMRYYYGVALVKQGDYQEAARQLDLALGGGAERTVGGDARFFLAAALEMLKQPDRARAEYLRFADAHPQSALAWPARRKAAEITQRYSSGKPTNQP